MSGRLNPGVVCLPRLLRAPPVLVPLQIRRRRPDAFLRHWLSADDGEARHQPSRLSEAEVSDSECNPPMHALDTGNLPMVERRACGGLTAEHVDYMQPAIRPADQARLSFCSRMMTTFPLLCPAST